MTVPPHTKRGFLSLFLVCALPAGQRRQQPECWCASCAIAATHQFISYSVNKTERKEWGVFWSDFFHFFFTSGGAAAAKVSRTPAAEAGGREVDAASAVWLPRCLYMCTVIEQHSCQ